MDVIKTNVEKIGGTVDVSSVLGKGTSIKIKIPLTLAIIPALIVHCGGDRFAIPQVSLLELVRLDGDAAKRSIVLSQFNLPYSLAGLANMFRLVQAQLKTIIDAVGTSDAEKAIEVWRSDEAVDDVYNGIFRELITYMMEDPRNITPCTHLLFIAKNLERIGDHATNIAETVHYAVLGEVLPDARPKGDNSPYAIVRPQE